MRRPASPKVAEQVVFAAAFDGGNEKLVRFGSPRMPRYVLRRNTWIPDVEGRELWNESTKEFESVEQYLSEVRQKIVCYTPTELSPEVADEFKDALFTGLRKSNQQIEKGFFNFGNSFNQWIRWSKLFQAHATRVSGGAVTVYCFGEDSPVNELRVEINRVRTFQELLNFTYTAFLMRTYETGRFGKDWTLYNLRTCQSCGDPVRSTRPPEYFVNIGDELAVLRLKDA